MGKSFIRLEIIPRQATIEHRGEQPAIRAGARRLEGRNHAIQDGDVVVV